MGTIFLFHKIEIGITRELFTQFGQIYSEESWAFLWAFEVSPNFDFLNYIIIGILTFTVILLLNMVFSKLEGKKLLLIFRIFLHISGYLSYSVTCFHH